MGSHLTLLRIAAIGALVAALGLAGCGRKGGLDPPPAAAVSEPTADGRPALGPDGKPVAAATAPRRSTPLDFLLD